MMNYYQLKRDIIDYAHSIGIDDIGFTSAEPFEELRPKLEEYYAKGYDSGFEVGTIDERINPKLSLPSAQSIIAIAVGYPNKLKDAPRSTKNERRGIFARASWGQDYHTLLNDRLNKLEAYIKRRVPEAECMNMVDTGVLSDRAVAERAGLGFTGRNGFVINPKLGTWTYLGEMLINLPFPSDNPIIDSCGDCTICVDRCPTGALLGEGGLDSKKCISFQTQLKGMMDVHYRKKIGNRLYGCDTCQQVCPLNKGINTTHEDIEVEPNVVKPLLIPLLRMSNREFKETYGHLAGAWRGKKPIQRNAMIALANFKDDSAIPELKKVISEDVRPMIVATAYWAIAEIEGVTSIEFIERALQKETEQIVLDELNDIMNTLRREQYAD